MTLLEFIATFILAFFLGFIIMAIVVNYTSFHNQCYWDDIEDEGSCGEWTRETSKPNEEDRVKPAPRHKDIG